MSFTVVPKLTEDATLKRARTDLTPQTSALTITGVTTPDLTPITDATGTPADQAWTSGDGTVVGLLKGIYTKLAPPKVNITKLVCSATGEELVEQATPSTALTLTVGYVYLFLKEKSASYNCFMIGGDGIDYGTFFYDNGYSRMFTNPTSTGAFNRTVSFYAGDDEVQRTTDNAGYQWGAELIFFKNTYEFTL